MSVGPRQFAAARALLGWSQTRLAHESGVSVSTVADFERGSRKPMPNNLSAMQNALEQAGLVFRDGGVVLADNRLSDDDRRRLVDATDEVWRRAERVTHNRMRRFGPRTKG